ncbi:MAG: RNA 3'-terminal phosphate cyclase [Pirellulales bacterium]|nr:RNA 3'-terminal phosphate cyclase [Pirellulales bacterium]
MIHIDGSQGEGGGQVLRSALTLSLVTGQAFRMEKIRARRSRPGLLTQHLTAVLAAAEVGGAELSGVQRGSQELTFQPREIRPGEYRFTVATAGSATLVLQTVLPALLTAPAPSRLVLEGGTHNPWAPPFEFLQRAFLPLLGRMGPRVEATLERAGFYPAGGGRFRIEISPVPQLQSINLLERGAVHRQSARAIVSRLPLGIARREIDTLAEALSWPADCCRAEGVDSAGPGNAVIVEIESQHVTEVFTAFGRKGVPAEAVAREAAGQVQRYLAAGAAVGEHLADQLLIPFSLSGGGTYRTLAPSSHMLTNVEVLRRFLPVDVLTRPLGDDLWEVAVQGR